MTLTVASPVAYSFLIIRNEQGRLTERTSSTTHSSHKWYNLSAADSEDVKNLQRRSAASPSRCLRANSKAPSTESCATKACTAPGHDFSNFVSLKCPVYVDTQ